jgi:sialate O-acetylesterase
MKIKTILLLSFLTLIGCQRGPSGLMLPSLISDNMLLQQKTDARIWGKANPGQIISVTPDWSTGTRAKTGEDGKWSVTLPTPVAGGPYTIKIEGSDTSITVNNVLIGEVWFCSGQSNMEMPMEGWPPVDTIMHGTKAIASASLPEIRLFIVQKKISGVPLEECTGKWEVCTPSTVRQFSATAYFFGRKLYDELHLPVGLIESAWGGTPVESWMSSDVLKNAGEFVTLIDGIAESGPLLAEYQVWLNGHKQVETKLSGGDKWKNLSFNDENAASPDLDDSTWPVMNLPVLYESIIGDFDGAIWFRKKVEIPPAFTGKDLILSLGPIDDMDRTYFNGTMAGAMEAAGFWQIERNYVIPGNLVKAGINTISVRVLDTQGGGGIWGAPGSMKLTVKSGKQEPLNIEGEWRYQPVAEWTSDKFYIFDLVNNDFLAKKRPVSLGPNTPTSLYNGMVNPVINYRIKGAIWYQGEANVGRADQYAKIFPLMIQNWRDAWAIKDFPFYYVQIAPYVYSNVDASESALLREAQAKSLKTEKTGMAVTLDIATVMNIHPPFKMEAGERLANMALANDYGMKVPSIGPIYKSMVCDGSTIKIQFDNTGTGLNAKNEYISEFEIAGKNGKYEKAIAKIVNNEVWVSALKVSEPESVRYCWRNGSVGTLFNSDGMPASQFRTKE